MSIGEFILEFSTSLFDLAVIFFLATRGLEKRNKNSLVDISGVVLFTLLMVMMNHYLGHTSLMATVVPVFGIFIVARYSYCVRVLRFLGSFVLFVAFIAIGEFIVIAFLTNYFSLEPSVLMDYNIYRIYYGILSKTYLIIPVYFTGKFLTREKIDFSPSVMMAVAILSINFIVGMLGLKLYNENLNLTGSGTNYLMTMLLCMALLSAFLIFYTRHVLSVERKTLVMEASEKEYKNMAEYMGEIENLYNDLRSQRHDYVNHVETIKGLIDNDDVDKAGNYAGDIINAEAVESKRLSISNSLVNSIIGYKKRKAEEMDIQLDYDVKLPASLEIKDIDMTIMLSNAIDNAIEACEKIEDNRYIDIYMNYALGKVKMNIKNSFGGKVVREGEKLATRKMDKKSHGLGLANIRRVVDKYEGIMEIKQEGNVFDLEIMI
ncbi:Sensor_kinase_SpoOB-type, alpha-helical domain [Dethiosulfatibacter aminovorans DSM 17477]|uniref:Sensor_kinase_SpoOB-type, alpha-helical domain n=1 Tax=Dethiosulfatibacter aminovorans DSM 17477 TaxID=1121476 RepID=A0A1M6JEK2_9FIRM|nr:sensor histidine kinase [Dethiosulfatibacter aminovorans]SHJ45176.1 Sensor_kinase_SpoOB-type, alpha-helical domain [Dethiosulfatibacter aminovorans DSM 17477]